MSLKAKYRVSLSPLEREELQGLVSKGKAAARKITHARVLLLTDESAQGPRFDDHQIVEALGTSLSTIHRVRQRLVEEGMQSAIEGSKPTNRQYRKLDGAQEARLVALACSKPPQGRSRWTLKLLAHRLVELEVVDSIGPECVRQTLKKTSLSLISRNTG